MTKADKVYLNSKIYCIQPRYETAEAVAIKEGKFIAVGTNEDIKAYVTNETEVVDLKGKTVIPGLHDMHIHAIMGAFKQQNECNLFGDSTNSLDNMLEAIREFVKKHPNKPWIIGGGWPAKYRSEINKFLLDTIDSTRPIYLLDFSVHNAWVNSKALELAGINDTTPDPEGGKIIRNEKGEPTGVLLENATKLVFQHAPSMSSQEAFAAGEWISKHLNSYGITSIKDPLADRITLETYQSLGKQDKLTLRVAACLRWKSDVGENIDINEQIALIRDREKYASKRINPNFAKLFLDGVVPYKTSAFLEPYIGDEMDNHDWRSTLLIDPEELKKELIYFDKEGITVKMHAIGDAAIRAGLDAIEAARNENGFSGLQHEIAHSVFVNAEDVTRFKKLDAVAEFSPPFWFPSEFHEQNKVNLLGRERADSNYLISSIKSTNALVVYGSDWPVVPLVNPWPGIEALVTRENPYEEYPGKLTPDEAIDIVEAIEMYTINGARSMYLEEYTGSIQVGKFADMIILDRDIFEINPKEIRNTKVLSTLVEGEVVHESSLTFN